MTQEFVTLPREVVEQALEALFEADSVRGDYQNVKVRRDSIAALRTALEQPQNHVPDVGNMVQAGWKPVPVEPTQEMLDQLRFRWSDISTAYIVDRWKRAVAAAPKPPTVKECLTVDQPEPAYLLRDLADDISVDALDLIAEIRDAGLGNYSINMKLPTRVCVAMCQKFSDAQQPQVEQEPVAEVIESHVRAGLDGRFTAEVAGRERLSVGAELFVHPQNLNCKSTQARLATLWGYVKEQPKLEPLTESAIVDIVIDMNGNEPTALFWRDLARSIEAAHGIK